MRVPRTILNALRKRVKAANDWNDADRVISEFIVENSLEDDIASEDFLGGVEGIVNPEASAARILDAIEKK